MRQALEGAGMADGVVGVRLPWRKDCALQIAGRLRRRALPSRCRWPTTSISPGCRRLTGPNDDALGARFHLRGGHLSARAGTVTTPARALALGASALEKPDVVVQVGDLGRPADFAVRSGKAAPVRLGQRRARSGGAARPRICGVRWLQWCWKIRHTPGERKDL